ncbi:MAG TPA: cupin domain-containing protein [Gemmatimonadaceae bacterium]|jgi:quercetin dioxygenase-like cupin family protein|nr:cupin domain-containing protein [Gemmatimonadaceae bacterium]
MNVFDLRVVAREAVAANPTRPATTIVHDTADARLVVFRLSPGQSVAPHRNASTVTLTVISGSGLASGADAERPITTGDVVTYDPNEVHGMRAADEELVLLATITPRPGSRGA